MKPALIYISSGKVVDLSAPQTADIDIEDIAWSLSNIMRFNGHLSTQISVARHCIEVSRLVPEDLALAALLHDAHEAYVGDITRPMKAFIEWKGVNVDEFEYFWQSLIWLKFDCLPRDGYARRAIEEADDLQMAREMTSLAPEGPFRDHGRALLKRYTENRPVTLLDPDNCDVNPRRDYASFKKRFFELD